MSHLQTRSPIEGLHVALAAYKSLLSDSALRTRQAEDMARLLMAEIPAAIRNEAIVARIKEHMETREAERSIQYLGVLQVTLMSLTTLQRQKVGGDQLEAELLEIIKALTTAVGASSSPSK